MWAFGTVTSHRLKSLPVTGMLQCMLLCRRSVASISAANVERWVKRLRDGVAGVTSVGAQEERKEVLHLFQPPRADMMAQQHMRVMSGRLPHLQASTCHCHTRCPLTRTARQPNCSTWMPVHSLYLRRASVWMPRLLPGTR